MDLNTNFISIQKILIELNNKGLWKVTDCISSLKTITDIVTADAQREITFFLLLNTNLCVSEQLKDDVDVGLLVHMCPPLDVSLYVDIIHGCGLGAHLCEIIANSPSVIVVELLETILEKLKDKTFSESYAQDGYIVDLIAAVYLKLCGLPHQKRPSKTTNTGKLFICFTSLLELEQQIISISFTLLKENSKMITFIGFQYLYLFELLNKCITWTFEECQKNNMFHLTSVQGKEEKKTVTKSYSNKCLYKLLTLSTNVLKDFTLDLWICWSELFYQETEKTIQRSIGEEVCKLMKLIEQYNVHVSAEMKNCFLHLQIELETEEEALNKADLSACVKKLRGEDSKWNATWFKALLSQSCVLENDTAREVISFHIHRAGKEDVQFILLECHSLLRKPELNADKESLTKLYMKGFQQLDLTAQVDQIAQIYLHEDSVFEQPDLAEQITETFNKFSKTPSVTHDSMVQSIVYLCLQSPSKTIAKICKMAVENSKQITQYVSLLELIRKCCFLPTKNGSFILTDELTELKMCQLDSEEKQGYILLVADLVKSRLLDEEFVRYCVLDSIYSDLQKCDLNMVLWSLEIFKACWLTKQLKLNKISLLAFLGQLLEGSCWDLTSFSSTKCDIQDICLKLKSSINIESDKEAAWLQQQLALRSDITKACFSDVWLHCGKKFPCCGELAMDLLVLIHSRSNVESQLGLLVNRFHGVETLVATNQLTVALVKILPVLSGKYWFRLVPKLKKIFAVHYEAPEVVTEMTVRVFLTSVFVLVQRTNRDVKCEPGLYFCLMNLGSIISKQLEHLADSLRMDVFEDLMWILNAMRPGLTREGAAMALSPVLLELLHDPACEARVRALLPFLQVEEVARAIEAKLANLSLSAEDQSSDTSFHLSVS